MSLVLAGPLAVLALGSTASPARAGSPATAAQSLCRYADTPARGSTGRRHADGALWCLINRERSSRGLNALARSSRLERVAQRHTRDMHRRRYFSHRSPGGRFAAERVDRYSSYLDNTSSWKIGETLAQRSPGRATARGVIHAMLASPSHRDVILTDRFRHLGVGWTIGTPTGSDRGATVAAVFGDR